MLPSLSPNGWLRFDIIRRHLRRLADVSSVLEIGAGQGALGARLARQYRYVGVEPDPRSASVARERVRAHGSGASVVPDLVDVSAAEPFDLVCAFEVLEHIEDDAAALRLWRSRLRAGGWLLLSVPAHQRRYGPWDRAVGHYRRYGRPQLTSVVSQSGFDAPVVSAFGFPLGYVLEWGRNAVAGRRRSSREPASFADATAASGRLMQPKDGLAWAVRLGTAPFRALQRPFVRSDLGTGFVVLARRAG